MGFAVDRPTPRSVLSLLLMSGVLIALFASFLALGSWQLHRRAWKLQLIDQVEQRTHAPAIIAPGPERWPTFAADNEYRTVRAEGRFLKDCDTRVQAVTERGAGFWVMTPLQTDAGYIVLINRGFIESDQQTLASSSPSLLQQHVVVTGLLRLSEPGGGFLHRNDPAAGRWYSRDVAAMAAARKLPLSEVAPYFIDADAGSAGDGEPIGGLTVVHFHNSHLVYAITWYTLAVMVAGAAVLLGRQEWTLRRTPDQPS